MTHYQPHIPIELHLTSEIGQVDGQRLLYASKLVKHMIDLTIWRAQMGDSMLVYIERVLNQIWKIYQQGMNILITSRSENIEDLQWILNEEKDIAEDAL